MPSRFNQTKTLNGRKFTLDYVAVDSPRDAQKRASLLRGQGFLARVEPRRYSPPYGREYNAYLVWKGPKRKTRTKKRKKKKRKKK